MKTLLILATFAALLPATAHAQRMSNLTGQKLVELCTSKDRSAVEGCTAFIDGIADTTAYYQRLRPANGTKGAALPGYICVPGPTTGVQLRQTVIDFARKNPDQGTRQASGIVLRALDAAYLCPGEQKRLAPAE